MIGRVRKLTVSVHLNRLYYHNYIVCTLQCFYTLKVENDLKLVISMCCKGSEGRNVLLL